MSYDARDAATDVGRFLRTRDRSWLAELRPWLGNWRCNSGLHRASWDPEAGRSWSSPGEPGYSCEDCGRDAFPVRVRLVIAFQEGRIGGRLTHAWFWLTDPEYRRLT